jgi:Heterokaryon incompatibility protein (HET)
MRLLERNGSGGFSLTEFVDGPIPRYAILSHTWGLDSDEVSFKNIMESTGNSKAGYEKITFCGERAAMDGLQYFWVDTCCIDKSSSQEVTEAINCMFQWYQNAAKCYVFLKDVSVSSGIENNEGFQAHWEPEFRSSRWFSRGWTLQELLAPRSLEFFSVEGNRLGDKDLLQQQLHQITGIPIQALQALQDCPLSQFSVSDRMSWAANRETKREEDVAYSLLGILEINMSLIYGEGRQKALWRLMEEVNRHSSRIHEINWPSDFLQPDLVSAKLAEISLSQASSLVPFKRGPNLRLGEMEIGSSERQNGMYNCH